MAKAIKLLSLNPFPCD